ncbi:AraC family transcriptional regulator [Enterobacter sp.]|uniref:AraC family transcriptional regulator n=1 Tax=Enterobacter sp. TaxID=42895 RepID=UPI00296FF983|nr:AraC family transcriptional regulator [Enterobacter sp.]
MADSLFDLCRRYADACAGQDGVALTPIRGMTMVRTLHVGELQVAVSKPLIAMLLQGRKRVTTGADSFDYGAGEAMVIAADVPTVSQITQASLNAPYYSLVLELDLALIRDIQAHLPPVQEHTASIRIEPFDDEVAAAAYRLVRLFDQQDALAVLGEGLLRELHYWLLRSTHGPAIRALGRVGSQAERIYRAVTLLREDFTRPIRIDELAAVAGMSVSAFHKHFRAITTLSPLQFQKQLRLIHARKMMLTEGKGIAPVAYAVGYVSVSHFTREYTRMFNTPPGRDKRTL